MTYPTKREAMEMLKAWKKTHANLSAMFDKLFEAVGPIHDSILYETVWKSFDQHTRALSAALGDSDDWLAWYFGENDMGANAYEAGYDGKLRKIKTLEDLYRLIEQGRGR